MLQPFCEAVWFTKANVTRFIEDDIEPVGEPGSGGGGPTGGGGIMLLDEKLEELDVSLICCVYGRGVVRSIRYRPSCPNEGCWEGNCGSCMGTSGSISFEIQLWTTESPLL